MSDVILRGREEYELEDGAGVGMAWLEMGVGGYEAPESRRDRESMGEYPGEDGTWVDGRRSVPSWPMGAEEP
jgi:hypothetical protein